MAGRTARALTERFERALSLAATLHGAQARKGSDTPYLSHLLQVAGIALENGADEDEAIAALLHDAVEDQGGPPTLERIRAEYGPRIADIVDACSDTDAEPKPPWRARKEAHIARLEHADRSVLLVYASDKLANLRSLLRDWHEHGEGVWSRFRGGREGTIWYFRTLAALFARRLPGPLAAELERELRTAEGLGAPSGPPEEATREPGGESGGNAIDR
jgi:(p)ppGpp synthase/HD superfamily hydrolase